MQPTIEIVRKSRGVCGGKACIRDTRIPVWTLQKLRNLGSTDDQLLEHYPSLTVDDLSAAWDYVRQHMLEIQSEMNQGRNRI